MIAFRFVAFLFLFLGWSSLSSAGYVYKYKRCDGADEPWSDTPPRPMLDVGLIGEGDSTSTLVMLRRQDAYTDKDACLKETESIVNVAATVHLFGGGTPVQQNWTADCIDGSYGSTAGYTTYTTFLSTKSRLELRPIDFELSARSKDETDVFCLKSSVTPMMKESTARVLKYGSVAILLFTSFCSFIGRARVRRQSRLRAGRLDRYEDPAESLWPGVIDCLQHFQFIVLSGALTLSMPGFFRPVAGQLAWSALMTFHPMTVPFRYPGTEDGIYALNATRGIEELAQSLESPSMMDLSLSVTLNFVIAMAVVACLAAVVTFFWRITDSSEEKKSWKFDAQFIGWNVLRVAFNYFLVPLIAFTSFQFYMLRYMSAPRIAMVSVTVAILVIAFVFTLFRLARNKRGYIFLDDTAKDPLNSSMALTTRMTLLIYCTMIFKGIVFGGLQDWGLAQVVCLACSDLLIMAGFAFTKGTLKPTRQTCAAGVRFVTMALMTFFIPKVDVHGTTKAWVGVAILCTHALYIVAAFVLLPFVQTLKDCFSSSSSSANSRGDEPAVYGLYQLKLRPVPPDQQHQSLDGFEDSSYFTRRDRRSGNYLRTPTPVSPESHANEFNRSPSSVGYSSLAASDAQLLSIGGTHPESPRTSPRTSHEEIPRPSMLRSLEEYAGPRLQRGFQRGVTPLKRLFEPKVEKSFQVTRRLMPLMMDEEASKSSTERSSSSMKATKDVQE